jgi:hypothetical protein
MRRPTLDGVLGLSVVLPPPSCSAAALDLLAHAYWASNT